jgi:hypothetical protein
MELDQKKYQNCGAQGELEKPFDVETMRSLIKNLVSYTKSQGLSGFLTFPESLKSEFVEEEKTLTAQRVAQFEVTATKSKPPEFESQPVIEFDATTDSPFSLEDLDVKSESDVEASSIFNLQTDGDGFDMNELEILASPPPEHGETIELLSDDNWEAKPLNDQSKNQEPPPVDDDLDGFQSMDLQTEQRLKLEDFLYQPEDGVTPPPPEMTGGKITNIRITASENTGNQFQNMQVSGTDNQFNTISPQEAEAIIRAETRSLIKKTIDSQLPKIMEKIVREELARVLEQELAIKSANHIL